MIFRPFRTSEHYKTIAGWWRAERFPAPVGIKYLPEVGMGVFDGSGRLLACGFLYMNGTEVSQLEWITASRALRHEERTKVLTKLIRGIKDTAQNSGCSRIFMSTRHGSLITRLEQEGFKVAESDMTNLYCAI